MPQEVEVQKSTEQNQKPQDGSVVKATSTIPATTSTDENISSLYIEKIIPEAKIYSTVGWRTCRNEKYGYTFKYPSEFEEFGTEDRINSPHVDDDCNKRQVYLTWYPHGSNPDSQPYDPSERWEVRVYVYDTADALLSNKDGFDRDAFREVLSIYSPKANDPTSLESAVGKKI